MHANEEKISERVIGCAAAVSNGLGAGFLEVVYHNALAIELGRQGLTFESQQPLTVWYRGSVVGEYVADFVINNQLIVEIKALTALHRQHEAQLMNYLEASGISAGLLLNFRTARLGIERMVAGHNDSAPV
ncbi:GxxExxY protein [Salinisphaera sp. SWV1]|uniref:GxxExxY protein n=1 Tax=Salinisphaera sp. SWV1 TaxID=3454139 RepID=UPI003F842AC1